MVVEGEHFFSNSIPSSTFEDKTVEKLVKTNSMGEA